MDTVLLLARLALAAIFVVAGVAKLADLAGSRKALADFGLPTALANPFGVLLPLAELTVALAVIPNTTAWWGAIGAFTLLLLFVIGIAASMARGKAPECHCFGQLHSEPAGWSTLARNAVLAGLAGFVILGGRDDPGSSPVGWLGDLSALATVVTIVGLLALGLLVVQWWFLFQLIAQNGRLLTRVERIETVLKLDDEDFAAEMGQPGAGPRGLPVGTPAPSFALPDLAGETISLDALRAAGKPVMLIFSDPNCGPCQALMPEIVAWQHVHSDQLTIAIIGRGKEESNRAKALEYGLANVLLAPKSDLPEQFKAYGTPSAVLVAADGSIASPVAAGADSIRVMLEAAIGEPAPSPAGPELAQARRTNGATPDGAAGPNGAVSPAQSAPPVQATDVLGSPAPALRLPDLNGQRVSLSDFRGSQTAVLFWNPGCAFSRTMLDDLKRWEAAPPPGAPKLLIVSAGPVEANRALGLRSVVVLDDSFRVGRQFGASGTPSAVLVDEEGRIASEVMAGAPNVWRLLVPPHPAVPAPAPPPAATRGNGAGHSAPAQGLELGHPVPELVLPDLNGETVNLESYRGTATTVLFWNPNCTFCQRMLDDLKRWEENPPPGSPRLLVVSAGSVEANREMGLRSPVLLDRGFAAGRRFGATGTPSAVLIDAEGRVTSGVAIGAPAVLRLIGAAQDQPSSTAR